MLILPIVFLLTSILATCLFHFLAGFYSWSIADDSFLILIGVALLIGGGVTWWCKRKCFDFSLTITPNEIIQNKGIGQTRIRTEDVCGIVEQPGRIFFVIQTRNTSTRIRMATGYDHCIETLRGVCQHAALTDSEGEVHITEHETTPLAEQNHVLATHRRGWKLIRNSILGLPVFVCLAWAAIKVLNMPGLIAFVIVLWASQFTLGIRLLRHAQTLQDDLDKQHAMSSPEFLDHSFTIHDENRKL